MASVNDIRKTILAVAGNPESGVVAEFATKWAEAIAALDSESPHNADAKEVKGKTVDDGGPILERPSKEIRITKPAEKR